jgi:hypothetical protein
MVSVIGRLSRGVYDLFILERRGMQELFISMPFFLLCSTIYIHVQPSLGVHHSARSTTSYETAFGQNFEDKCDS